MPQSSDDDTLASEQQNDHRQQNQPDGGESGKREKHDGGKPVGFWNKDLKAVRLYIFKKWAITSMSRYSLQLQILHLVFEPHIFIITADELASSPHSLHLHSCRHVVILGRPIPR